MVGSQGHCEGLRGGLGRVLPMAYELVLLGVMATEALCKLRSTLYMAKVSVNGITVCSCRMLWTVSSWI